ncbi:MAG TPA: transcriptional regulator [Actinomycetota bacterium]
MRAKLLDQVVHQPARLGILGMLRPGAEVEFRALREELELSDSSLSQHLTILEEAGYVKIRKGAVGRRPRTWASMTRAGRDALARYVEAIQHLAGQTR